MEVGTRWVEAIERELKAAQFFAVLLSEQSVRSDMVRQEVALAHERAIRGELCILPIRVSFAASLPYDLAAYLNPFQHCEWCAGETYDGLCGEIARVVSRRPLRHTDFDNESLDKLARELAVFVGPVARVLVNRAAKHAQDLKHLRAALAQEIPVEDERKAFLAKAASH